MFANMGFHYMLKRRISSEQLGISVRFRYRGGDIEVDAINDDGVVAANNRRMLELASPECADHILRVGDQILNANGKTTEEDIRLELLEAPVISMHIRRNPTETTPQDTPEDTPQETPEDTPEVTPELGEEVD